MRPTLLYAGDGVSDLSAAAETDLLFAKKGKGAFTKIWHWGLHYVVTNTFSDLVTFCEREKIPFTLFESWESILATTKDILGGKVSVKEVAQDGLTAVHEGANKNWCGAA